MYKPIQKKLFKKYFKTELELDDLLYNISLMLRPSHPSVNNYAKLCILHVPSITEIGGFHITQPKKIPQDLQNFLDNATEGVVVFSVETNLRSKDFTLEVRKALLDLFSKVKQKILWKFETIYLKLPEMLKL